MTEVGESQGKQAKTTGSGQSTKVVIDKASSGAGPTINEGVLSLALNQKPR